MNKKKPFGETKEDLLEIYGEHNPVEFIKHDIIPDPKKTTKAFTIYSERIHQLTSNYYTIRVLIKPETKKEIAIEGLKGLIKSLENRPEQLQRSYYLKMEGVK